MYVYVCVSPFFLEYMCVFKYGAKLILSTTLPVSTKKKPTTRSTCKKK